MAKQPARAVTDEELLSGEDGGEQVVDPDGMEDLEAGEDEIIGGEPQTPKDGEEDELEVVIVDDDEGADKGQAGKDADGGDTEGQEIVQDQDDDGEPIGEDFLTDWEKKNHSKAMQKRINRERRIKEEERQARVEAETKLHAEVQARQAAEAQARTNMKFAMGITAQNLEYEIEKKTAALRKAKEGGETDDELKLENEIADLRMKRQKAKDIEEQLAQEPQPKPEAAAAAPQNPLVQRWRGRNKWYGDQKFKAEADFTAMIDREIFAEKRLSPNTPEYFVELDRRIHDRMPALRVRIRKEFGAGPAGKPAMRTMPVIRGNVARGDGAKRTNKVELTRADLQNMRDFGMDPANKGHLREYAEQKRQRIEKGG